MKTFILKVAIAICLLFVGQQLLAQKSEAPNFTYNFDGKIDFMKLTDSGILVVANGDGFAGIKP